MNQNFIQKKETATGQKKVHRVVLLESNIQEAMTILPFAEKFIHEKLGRLIILSVLSIPADEKLSQMAAKASRLREEMTAFISRDLPSTTRVRTLVRTEKEIWEGIRENIIEDKVDAVFAHWNALSIASLQSEPVQDHPLMKLPCEVVVVRPSCSVADTGIWGTDTDILLPVRGTINSSLMLRVSDSLARLVDGTVTLLHVSSPGARETTDSYTAQFTPALYGLENIKRSLIVKGELPDAILNEVADHETIIIGVPDIESKPADWLPALINTLLEDQSKTLILVKDRKPAFTAPDAADIPSRIREHPLAVVVDKWFAENTYHSQEFADLDRLLAFKKEQDLTISLGLPSLNEEETVGNVITTIQNELMKQVPLLDEIVLIDSGSTDRTRQIARELGIRVFLHQEILPETGAYHGKGEALWKSLHVLSGDIVAWIDTDIKNIHPRFVYGILGPLLVNRRIQYVKGFYRRPLRRGDKLVAGGGGRVTELTARPLINLFFPELSGLIQPLSGEYAGRRSALEQLPFFTGYGVETGLLIDLLHKFGLKGIAQVDLVERIHHNQLLPSLSKMSFAILQVVINRLEKRHAIQLLNQVNLTMNLIRYSQLRGYFLEQEEIQEIERPPIQTIAEYQSRRERYATGRIKTRG
jgi:glucosyl-3-phosphoglycerate synthase